MSRIFPAPAPGKILSALHPFEEFVPIWNEIFADSFFYSAISFTSFLNIFQFLRYVKYDPVPYPPLLFVYKFFQGNPWLTPFLPNQRR